MLNPSFCFFLSKILSKRLKSNSIFFYILVCYNQKPKKYLLIKYNPNWKVFSYFKHFFGELEALYNMQRTDVMSTTLLGWSHKIKELFSCYNYRVGKYFKWQNDITTKKIEIKNREQNSIRWQLIIIFTVQTFPRVRANWNKYNKVILKITFK